MWGSNSWRCGFRTFILENGEESVEWRKGSNMRMVKTQKMGCGGSQINDEEKRKEKWKRKNEETKKKKNEIKIDLMKKHKKKKIKKYHYQSSFSSFIMVGVMAEETDSVGFHLRPSPLQSRDQMPKFTEYSPYTWASDLERRVVLFSSAVNTQVCSAIYPYLGGG